MASEDVSLRLRLQDEASAAMSRATSGMLSSLKSLGAGFLSIEAGRRIIDASTKAFVESAQAARGLGVALRATGQEARLPEVEALAKRLEQLTSATDEQILSVAAQSIALGVSVDALERFTDAARTMAALTNSSFTSAMDELNRSLAGQSREMKRLLPEYESLTDEQKRNGVQVELLIAAYGKLDPQLTATERVINRKRVLWDNLTESVGAYINKLLELAATNPALGFNNPIMGILGGLAKPREAAAGSETGPDIMRREMIAAGLQDENDRAKASKEKAKADEDAAKAALDHRKAMELFVTDLLRWRNMLEKDSSTLRVPGGVLTGREREAALIQDMTPPAVLDEYGKEEIKEQAGILRDTALSFTDGIVSGFLSASYARDGFFKGLMDGFRNALMETVRAGFGAAVSAAFSAAGPAASVATSGNNIGINEVERMRTRSELNAVRRSERRGF